MVKRAATLMEESRNIRGGKGEVVMRHILDKGEMAGKGRLFCTMTLHPGDSIGHHLHEGDFETFYILSGQGTAVEEGARTGVSAGDVVHTRNGESHALENTGTEDLVLVALILFA